MDKKEKVVALLAVVLGGIGLIKLLGKKEGAAAKITMRITDDIGNPISALIGGKTYIATITVKNTSTQGGVPVSFTMTIQATALMTEGLEPIPWYKKWISEVFAPGETKTFTYSFALPSSAMSATLTLAANAIDLAGKVIATASSLTVSVAPAEIIPGAEVNITLPP